MNLKNIWSKITGEKFFSGILIDENKVQIIKLKKDEDNFFPIYWSTLDFSNSRNKSKNIEFFKKIKNKLQDENVSINFSNIDENDIEEIISDMKISGFKKVKISKIEKNIDLLFTAKDTLEKTVFLFLSKNGNIYLNFITDHKIYKKEKFIFEELNSKKINEITQEIENKQIFISGNYNNILEEKGIEFNKEGIELKIFNPWTNILDFKYKIPEMLKSDTHKYLEIISLTLPALEGIQEKEDEDEKEVQRKIENLDFIKSKKKDTEIIFEKELFWKNKWNSFKKEWDGSVFAVFWKFKKEKNKNDKKIFLLKPKLKLFLPKPLKNKKISKKKVKKEKSPKTKKNKDKHKKTKRKTISKKKK